MEKAIGLLLQPWAERAGPGVTVGVVVGGALALHRSAGLASVELGVPIGDATRFRIASVSKQFTTAAVLMLEREGRLSADDLVTAHLPEMPEFGITVSHLMHNTSGIRDMLEIMRHGGADLGTPIPLSALVEGICRQRALNFAPGSRFLYSNSNFLLLGLIAERVGGEALPEMLRRRFFGPSGMESTLMTPDVHVVVPGLATGYLEERGGGWRRAAHAFPLHGEGGLVSTVGDLVRWDRHLVADAWLAEALARQTPFLNGMANRYARGQVVQAYRGVRTVSHGGLWPGYRTEFLRAPGEDVAVVVISNDGAAVPSALAHRVLDAVLEGRAGVHPVAALPGATVVAGMVGRYVDAGTGATLDLGVAADGHPTMTTHGMVQRAEATGDGGLASPRASSVFVVRPAADGVEVEQDAGVRSVWSRAAGVAALPEGLAGVWRSGEMGADWTVVVGQDGAEVRSRGPVAAGGAWRVEPVVPDVVRVHVPGALYASWFDVRVVRDGGGVAVALEVSGGRTKAVRYERVG